MTDGHPFPPPDAPPPPPPPPPPPGSPPGSNDDTPGPQPPERRIVPFVSRRSPLAKAFKDAAALALDALDYAGDRVAERITGDKRPTKP